MRLPDSEVRVSLAVAQLVGVAVFRYALQMEPIASMSADDLVARLTPVITRHLGEGRHSAVNADLAQRPDG